MQLEQYIHALKHKDNNAFEAVYHKTKHAVYAMVLPIVKDRSLAEDAMQITYIKMIENIHSYKPRYKFINWLLTIAKNTALDIYRQRSKETNLDIQESDDMFIDARASGEKTLEAAQYLDVLTEEEQHIVLLKVVAERKHKDIAKLLNKPVGTITWMYAEAIKKMRQAGEVTRDET